MSEWWMHEKGEALDLSRFAKRRILTLCYTVAMLLLAMAHL